MDPNPSIIWLTKAATHSHTNILVLYGLKRQPLSIRPISCFPTIYHIYNTHTHTHTHTHTQTCVYTHIHTHSHTDTRVHTDTNTVLHMSANIPLCVCASLALNFSLCILSHTHIHGRYIRKGG